MWKVSRSAVSVGVINSDQFKIFNCNKVRGKIERKENIIQKVVNT